MAFRKPSKKTMQVLEKYLEPRSFEAFVKEQEKSKYFDVTTTLARENVPLFHIVPKEGVDTLGYGREAGFSATGIFPNYKKVVYQSWLDKARELDESLNKGNHKLKKFIFRKIWIPLADRAAHKEIKEIQKKHPERMVLPALRAAGDEVNKLETSVDRAKRISDVLA